MVSTADAGPVQIRRTFRPTARLLQLLGDELIASPRLAVFELVKNAYDADATSAVIRLDIGHGAQEASITVTDDGEGMTLDVLESVWLVPGNNHRKRQRERLQRTPRHGRLPIGEKGLGRFAAHKLGNRISLVTRAKDGNECVVDIDWNELASHEYLEDAPVTISTRQPEVFAGKATGTRIRVTDLRSTWQRGDVRRLHNQITSLCSPFDDPGNFKAILNVPGNEQWTSDLPDVDAILDRAFWKFSFRLEEGEFTWDYDFRSIPGIKLASRSKHQPTERLALPKSQYEGRGTQNEFADGTDTDGIGPVEGVFYAYDRDRNILSRLPDRQAITGYLDEFGGIRVYRDGIRVYNYGEQGDDWLGLDLRRVNVPARRISRNIVLGAIHLSLADSPGLIEKTNREGFVDNDACDQLQRIILGAIGTFESERYLDKERIRQLSAAPGSASPDEMEGLLARLRRELRKVDMNSQPINSCLRRIERSYNEMNERQEILLSAGMSGMNLAVVFHEVERGVRSLHQALVAGVDINDVERQAKSLAETLDGFSLLLRRNSQEIHSARRIIQSSLQISDIRLKYHRVHTVCPLLAGHQVGFTSRFAFNLVLGALNNLIDNSLYWLRRRWPDTQDTQGTQERKLYIGVSRDLESGPAIVVADNGPGFQGDTPEYLARPFFTRRPDGMGLGLYYASLAMSLQNGRLVFPSPGEVEVPHEFDGAVVALVFKEDE